MTEEINEEIDPSKYYFHLRFSIKGKMMIDEKYEDIDQAVRRMNNLGSEWNIQTQVVPLYASGERNEMRLELKGLPK